MVVKIVKRTVEQLTKSNWRAQSRGMIIGKELNNFKKAFKENFITLIVSASVLSLR